MQIQFMQIPLSDTFWAFWADPKGWLALGLRLVRFSAFGAHFCHSLHLAHTFPFGALFAFRVRCSPAAHSLRHHFCSNGKRRRKKAHSSILGRLVAPKYFQMLPVSAHCSLLPLVAKI